MRVVEPHAFDPGQLSFQAEHSSVIWTLIADDDLRAPNRLSGNA